MNGPAAHRPTVVIIGGGYGGINAAKALDDHADVVLVEAKDAFQHNVAALRGVVDRAWPARMFLPYDDLLTHGTVVHDRAIDVDARTVTLASGKRLAYDYLVLATGSTYPFPAKADHPVTADAIAGYHDMHAQLDQARRVLLLGAGAVGLELAGEIAHVWPDKEIILVDAADEILPGPFDQALRDELTRQLDEIGVRRVLGSPLVALPPVAPGRLETFAVSTTAGTRIEADIWFLCFGTAPATSYLADDLAAARTAEGYLQVTPELQVTGFENVYAVGDVSDIDANKAGAASRQAEVVATNIKAQIAGSADRASYTVNPPAIVLPLGPKAGAGQMANGDIMTADFVAEVKGGHLMIDRYAQLLNITATVPG